MTIYIAKFHTDAEWAEEEFTADTPEQALALARAFYDDHADDLMFQGYDGGFGLVVNEIEIIDPDGELLVWRDDSLHLELAARNLLEACEVAVERLELNNCQGEEQPFIDRLRAVIAEATARGEMPNTGRDGDLPPNPDGKNDARATRAESALRHFENASGADHEDALGDLLCDLMHWCDRADFDFEATLLRAQGHYRAETSLAGEGRAP